MISIDLSGRRALVTGAARGLGRACALTLAEAGAQVGVVDLNLQGAEETAQLCAGGMAWACDVADCDAVEALAPQVERQLGDIDILVNNAGIVAYAQGAAGFSLEQWDRVLDVNLRGTVWMCRALLPGLKRRGGGAIVNFSSLAARVGGIEAGLHYAASKAGLIGVTRTLAKECGPYGITVNAIAPGIIGSDTVLGLLSPARQQQLAEQALLRRLGTPQDVANVVLFLVSPLASYITGTVIDINGGMYLG
ncbi:MAG: SDR family NAD(P)-dependent oxidoreductase [Anaerolineae bacterium]|jgi:NAD(P)-dependent dehydrogenase (short-subunit alcohol dehydrogenase family)|nr:SDR family oxidoreductase [Chloroflexota bacterium]